ncbi:MAG: HAMP domain-containing protein [Dechloromonas agitata]|uniref:Oxygen sensor histidine kinase NreB n=1 Tax=Dechloromonas agitata TaxID=73030 RepID=A0A930G1L1_9RHOO|nr:histidine kinase [Acidovorax sp. 210-6]MBF1164898.1 HAMP domain-containing protein [Dechloromonas agitata]NCU66773.1 HAMP domain-containing protein [Acidovorax sp. 210-6]
MQQPFALPDASLHTRVGLVLTGLAACLLLVLGGLWLHATRNAVHEEVEAATRVSGQWLKVMLGQLQALPEAERGERLLAMTASIGRVRANVLEVRDAAGQLRYVSPPSPYKAGRTAPAWFAALLASDLPGSRLPFAGYELSLHPDPSRAVLDAWDELLGLAGWALLLLIGLFAATRRALARALRPLNQVMQALDRTGMGRFDTRLPRFASPELGRLSRAFNGMADRLKAAVDDNVRLETAKEVAEQMQARVEAERRAEREGIARELHDELAQGVTAVRALAGAIVQRTTEQPALHSHAQSIVAVTGEMQDGVRRILHRLRTGQSLVARLESTLDAWRRQHPIQLTSRIALTGEAFDDEVAQCVLRTVQEGLTNIVRHADASRVDLTLLQNGATVQIRLADNGRGLDGRPSGQAGCGLGLQGMRERIALLGGQLEFATPAGGGFVLQASLPVAQGRVEA